MRRRDFIYTTAVVGAGSALAPRWSGSAWARTRVASGSQRIDDGWRFLRGDPAGAELPRHGDSDWERVILPHSARVEALVTGAPGTPTYQWQGVAWYRRALELGDDAAGKKVFLKFDAAMNVAEVFLDGERIAEHMGGWLPIVVDITDRVTPNTPHVLAVRLDNRDNAITGPKPLAILDFNMYGGLYRHVHLIVKDRLHITDPILADEPASGGVFVDFPEVSRERALVRVRTHVRNDYDRPRSFAVLTTVLSQEGDAAAGMMSRPATIRPGEDDRSSSRSRFRIRGYGVRRLRLFT